MSEPRPCPTCREPAEAGTGNPFRPFCSQRCKMVDLYRWLDGTYRVPGEDAVSLDPSWEPDGSKPPGDDNA